MNPIDEIKNKVDIVEVIAASGVNLRKTGRSFVGFCPFHPNTRTPAFTVYPDTQSFYCFGCHASGTVFDYVMRRQGLDFKDALEQLAARAGVHLEPKGEQERQEDARRTKLLEINSLAARVFHHLLVNSPRGEPGRAYVAKRELSPDVVESFQIGYSPDEWGFLFAYLTEKKGFAPEDIEAAGLAIHHESGRFYDRFRGRLIFPIRDAKGNVVGFGGRALGDGQPKYLNTPETLLFKKGELLYGLDLARDSIRSEDRTIVVEGYIDVITAHQHGFRNLVAPLGTALTRNHVTLLKRLSHNVYLALDADAAGQKATLRGLSALRESAEAGEGAHMVATAQGAVRLESDVSLRIIKMPEGRDPDEVIKADPELWRSLVGRAVPVMDFYINAYTTGLDLSLPEQQTLALERLLPLLRELNEVRQQAYILQIEKIVGIKSEQIVSLLKGGSLSALRRQAPKKIRADQGEGEGKKLPSSIEKRLQDQLGKIKAQGSHEHMLLALALLYPTVPVAVEALLEKSLEKFGPLRNLMGVGLEDLFEDVMNQQIWAAYSALPLESRPTTIEGLRTWSAWLEEPLQERFEMIMALGEQRPQDFRHRQEAEDRTRKLRHDQARRWLGRLKEQFGSSDDPDEQTRLMLLLDAVGRYAESMRQPRRSSTFQDLRDMYSRE